MHLALDLAFLRQIMSVLDTTLDEPITVQRLLLISLHMLPRYLDLNKSWLKKKKLKEHQSTFHLISNSFSILQSEVCFEGKLIGIISVHCDIDAH